jgi:predicted ATPase
MLTQLELQNFKAWRQTGRVNLTPITGFFGANSSGKSALIQALLLLKQTKESPDRRLALNFGDQNSYVNLGTFNDAVHGHAKDKSIELSLKWRLQEPLSLVDPHRIYFKHIRRD